MPVRHGVPGLANASRGSSLGRAREVNLSQAADGTVVGEISPAIHHRHVERLG
jgi:hypothetical protein